MLQNNDRQVTEIQEEHKSLVWSVKLYFDHCSFSCPLWKCIIYKLLSIKTNATIYTIIKKEKTEIVWQCKQRRSNETRKYAFIIDWFLIIGHNLM